MTEAKDYYTPKGDSVTLPAGVLGNRNFVRGEVIETKNLPDHVKEQLADPGSRLNRLLKAVENSKALRYLKARDEGHSHNEAAQMADNPSEEELEDVSGTEERVVADAKAAAQAKAIAEATKARVDAEAAKTEADRQAEAAKAASATPAPAVVPAK